MKAKDLKILRKKLTKLNKTDFDPLKRLPDSSLLDLKSKNHEGEQQNLKVQYAPSKYLKDHLLQEFLELFERNMGEMYKSSSWGLNMDEKVAEFKHANARFIFLTPTMPEEKIKNQSVAGFVHFRFDYDDEENPTAAVLYVYEIQLAEGFRRQGLGKSLMSLAEQVAASAETSKVMLTVFKRNHTAMEFYKGLDYDIDPCSPSRFNEPADYEILSRSISSKP